ncbi:MAG: hypothetical protein DM484_09520 [Candidatus Methylumidiphilus alinenensis]|uniref:Winged helix-turn helix domain-containing protein n=1 Tax=Candidatus Methylumidiphilus alinenensis TaxID=2202197 RepID=A0A2W4RLY4_9GAMM|nr:MAG: hypothetical protein DM484_09520 [Candidatus Methylumidiphilus alinenensis]
MSSPYSRKYAHIVKNLLLQREDLTHKTLIDMGHGWRLAAVIHYIKKRKNWPIETERDMRNVAHYRLPTGWQPGDAGATAIAHGKGATE